MLKLYDFSRIETYIDVFDEFSLTDMFFGVVEDFPYDKLGNFKIESWSVERTKESNSQPYLKINVFRFITEKEI